MKRVILKVNKYHKQLQLELNDTYMLNKQKTAQIYSMIATEMKRYILKVNKYYKQLQLEFKRHLHTEQVENRVDLRHDS